MNTEKRKALRLRVQAHPAITPLRKQIAVALDKLPAIDPAHAEKLETLTRRMLGMKMPTRVVMLQRGNYAVRPCVSGIVFTAAVFQSLGGPENRKLCAPLTRLADAISYHFRASRLRGRAVYNFDAEQAKADATVLHSELESLSKILVECGVPVMGNSVESIKWAPTPLEVPMLASQESVEALEKRIEALERIVKANASHVSIHETRINELNEPKPVDCIGKTILPSSF